MKKFMYATLVAMFVFTSVTAQENGKNVIKIEPFGALLGSYSMSYERVVSAKSSVQVDANYGNINLFGLRINTLGIGAGYRYYFSKAKSVPEGFFVSPTLSLSSLSLYMDATPTNKITTGIFEGGVVAGYQWIFNSGLQLDLYVGPGYSSVTNVTVQDQEMQDYIGKLSGFGPKLGFSIGYCF